MVEYQILPHVSAAAVLARAGKIAVRFLLFLMHRDEDHSFVLFYFIFFLYYLEILDCDYDADEALCGAFDKNFCTDPEQNFLCIRTCDLCKYINNFYYREKIENAVEYSSIIK
jgi:hypothetical protein